MSCDRLRIRGDDRGQAVVELALVLPLVVLFVLGALQVAVVARDQLAIEYVAREAARAAAVSADPGGAARAAAHRVTNLAPIDVSVSVAGEVVRVRVRYVNATDVALVGAAIDDVTLEATAAMAGNRPDARLATLRRVSLRHRTSASAGATWSPSAARSISATVPALYNALASAILDHPATTIAVDLDGVEALDDVGLGDTPRCRRPGPP